jgi:NhaP-type Na+/H+ or K+/H+ antiporter
MFVGIALGLVLGIVIVVLFVFLGSEQTVDAPSIDHGASTSQEAPTRESGH